MKLVDALTVTLRDWDVRYVFGVSGANIEHFHDAIHRLGQRRLQSVMAKSEVGAAFMADCRARVWRTLGVCCATSGGGMMNLTVGIAEAYADAAPVLAIVGQAPTNLEGRGAFQDSSGQGATVNAVRLWSSISKYCAKITRPKDFWPSLTIAVQTALSGRPGPSVLLIPRDLYDQDVGPRPSHLPVRLQDLIEPQHPSSAEVDALFGRLTNSRRPVLLLGAGAERSSRRDEVISYARQTGTPVATTLASKATYPNDDPLYLGMVGVAGEPSVHRYLETEADLIVAVGTTLDVMTRQPLKAALSPERLVAVGLDFDADAWTAPPGLMISGDPGLVFHELKKRTVAAGIAPRTVNTVPVVRFVPQLAAPVMTDDWSDPFAAFSSPETEFVQSTAIDILQSFLPRVGHVLFDAGNCAAAALHGLRIPRGVTSTIALGMGGMGYAIGGAIGAQLGGSPQTSTLVVCGDGAFLMQGFEIHTAIHYGLPILFVVFNNGMHGMCVTRQQLYFGGRVECAHYPRFSAATVARGLGGEDRLWVRAVDCPLDLCDALDEYNRYFAHGPGVLELLLTREEIPPFTPFLAADAPTYCVNDSRIQRHAEFAKADRRSGKSDSAIMTNAAVQNGTAMTSGLQEQMECQPN